MENKTNDYQNLKNNPQIVNNEKIYFSAQLQKYNEFGFRQERTLAITSNAIYNIKKKGVQRRIPLEKLDAMSLSSMSSEFVLHVKGEYDYRFLSYDKREEIVEIVLRVVIQDRQLCTAFPIYFVPMVNLTEIMTTQNDLKNGKVVRPEKEYLKVMNLEKYKDSEKSEQKRKTELRKNTKTLYAKKDKGKDVCIDDFELLKVLGRGAFGKVFLGQRKEDGKVFAIKSLRKQEILDNKQLEHTLTEKRILKELNHPFLVGLEYAFQTPEKIYFVMEFMKGGELYQYLMKLDKFKENQAKFYAACITLALGHLHNSDFIYRDLKLENILLDEKGYARLADFGLAKFLKNNEKAVTFCGTPEYLCPELLLEKGLNRMADWWSLGILIYEMLYGMPPFYSSNVQNMYKKIVRDDVNFRHGVKLSDEGKDLIKKLLCKNPNKRLGNQADSLEVLSHPWFSDLNWSMLQDKKIPPPIKPKCEGEDWMKNFDREFINEKVRDSDVKVNLEILRKFQKEFDEMNYNKDKDDE